MWFVIHHKNYSGMLSFNVIGVFKTNYMFVLSKYLTPWSIPSGSILQYILGYIFVGLLRFSNLSKSISKLYEVNVHVIFILCLCAFVFLSACLQWTSIQKHKKYSELQNKKYFRHSVIDLDMIIQ